MTAAEINLHMWQDIAVIIGLVAALAVWMAYVVKRWSWIPRKEQRQRFGEKI